MKHVWTLDEAPARAGRRPGALAEYKALRDACVWRPAVLSHKLLILRNDGQTEVEGTRITECVVDAPGADGTAVFLIRRLGVPDGTDLVPHQHCNWGASIAFDGDI